MKPTKFDHEVIEIVSLIRQLRNEKQANLAELLEITQPEYSRIENGGRPLTLGHLQTICNYLQVSLQEIIHMAENCYRDRSTCGPSLLGKYKSLVNLLHNPLRHSLVPHKG